VGVSVIQQLKFQRNELLLLTAKVRLAVGWVAVYLYLGRLCYGFSGQYWGGITGLGLGEHVFSGMLFQPGYKTKNNSHGLCLMLALLHQKLTTQMVHVKMKLDIGSEASVDLSLGWVQVDDMSRCCCVVVLLCCCVVVLLCCCVAGSRIMVITSPSGDIDGIC